jgi:OmpA-OmpF porin, OOP family
MQRIVMATVLAALATGASADGFFEEPAAYGGIGYAKQEFDDDGYFDGASRDDEDNGLHVFGGYRFNRYLAVELSMRDLGEYSASGPGYAYSSEFTAVTIGAVGTLPLGDYFSLYGRIGAGAVSLDERVSFSGGRDTEDDAGGTSTLGAGVEFRPMGKTGLAVRLGWESHFFTVETSRVVFVNGGGGFGYYYYDEDEYDQRIDSFGLDIAYYFSL